MDGGDFDTNVAKTLLGRASEWITEATMASDTGSPEPSENEGKNLDADIRSFLVEWDQWEKNNPGGIS